MFVNCNWVATRWQ